MHQMIRRSEETIDWFGQEAYDFSILRPCDQMYALVIFLSKEKKVLPPYGYNYAQSKNRYSHMSGNI